MAKDIEAKSYQEAGSTILAKVVYPVASEIGEYLKQRFGSWRSTNGRNLLEIADAKYEEHSVTGEERPPLRILHKALEDGSLTDDKTLQNMWAGLLASSCTDDGDDESAKSANEEIPSRVS